MRVQRCRVADQPAVAERVGEAALPVHAPRHLMIPHRITRAVRTGGNRPADEGVRVVDKHLDPRRYHAAGKGGREPAGGLVQKERRTVDVQAANTAKAPQL